MDFVVACSNIRSFIYNIPQKTRFDVKSMAGNIIPAIATTNAVIAGGIVMEALKIINVSIKIKKSNVQKKSKVQKSTKTKKSPNVFLDFGPFFDFSLSLDFGRFLDFGLFGSPNNATKHHVA